MQMHRRGVCRSDMRKMHDGKHTSSGCARMQPAGHSGSGTVGGCLNGCAFHSPFPSSPL